jgi:ABC-2 type transport system ATP-binding protein
LTTQYLDEADDLCDRIAVIDHGRVIAEGTSGELKASAGDGALRVWLVNPRDRAQARELLARELDVPVRVEADAASLSARVTARDDAQVVAARAARALAQLSDSGVALCRFSLDEMTLDEAFLTLTGAGLNGHPADAEGQR